MSENLPKAFHERPLSRQKEQGGEGEDEQDQPVRHTKARILIAETVPASLRSRALRAPPNLPPFSILPSCPPIGPAESAAYPAQSGASARPFSLP